MDYSVHSPEDGYKSVRKWTSKFDIFTKKYIIVPINEKCASMFRIHAAHSSLLIVSIGTSLSYTNLDIP